MVPSFPPKKIFTLTPGEVEQRREHLEKYMQAGEMLTLTLTFLKKERKNPMTHRRTASLGPWGWRSFISRLRHRSVAVGDVRRVPSATVV